LYAEPAWDNEHILTFNEAVEAQFVKERNHGWRLAESRKKETNTISAARFLCARGERPRNGCAAEERDEIASFQLIEEHLIPASQGQIVGYRIDAD